MTRAAVLFIALAFSLIALLSLGIFLYQGGRSESIGATFGSTRLAFLHLLGHLLRVAVFAVSALNFWRYGQCLAAAMASPSADWAGVSEAQKRAWVSFAVLVGALAAYSIGYSYLVYEWTIDDWTDSGRYE